MLRNSQFENVLLLVVIGLFIYFLTKPSNPKAIKNMGTLEEPKQEPVVNFDVEENSDEMGQTSNEDSNESSDKNETDNDNISETEANTFKPTETEGGATLNSAFSQPIPEGTKTNAVDFNKNYIQNYDSKNYLPKEVNDEWFDTDFTQAKNKLENDSLINTDKYVIGIDTVGQSLKNASYDIRGTVANPKYSVSPWNNSTYEADYNIKPLC